MTLDSLLFKFSHKVKQLIHAHTGHAALIPTPSTSTGSSSGRLPLLKVPTFDGIILHWAQFWEQFTLSIHQCTDLANAEKLVYLQLAIKDGSAKTAIEGLSHSGHHYADAVESLKSRFDHPRLIHREHVRKCSFIKRGYWQGAPSAA